MPASAIEETCRHAIEGGIPLWTLYLVNFLEELRAGASFDFCTRFVREQVHCCGHKNEKLYLQWLGHLTEVDADVLYGSIKEIFHHDGSNGLARAIARLYAARYCWLHDNDMGYKKNVSLALIDSVTQDRHQSDKTLGELFDLFHRTYDE
jgi:hypothetical protein